jgi:hypothetical protein
MDAQVPASKPKQAAIRIKYRKDGRPSKQLQLDRRHLARKRFRERFGIDIIALMKDKGYFMTKYDAKLAKKQKEKALKANPELAAEVESEHVLTAEPKVANDAFADKPADKVITAMVRSLLKGERVPGFTLVPEGKADKNITVESIIIPSFPQGNPAYGMSLVSLKEQYAD